VSRHWIAARREDPKATLTVSFLPDETFESLDESLQSGSVRGRVPARLLEALGQDTKTKDARRALVRKLVELPLPIIKDRGFDYAEVTAGGVPLSEIDLATMVSRKCEHLYLCGEILDVDGRIGGFNFQWAWASGRLAGLNAARSLHSDPP
jgi:predicted flavoprotein YhiN